MNVMARYPDKYFDLAVVDPPYGNGKMTNNSSGGGADRYWERFGGWFDRYRGQDRREMGCEVRKKIIAWDTAPGKAYFQELFRVSRNQIIWGGNYFMLPPTRCFLIWEKENIPERFTMAMCEYAWTSFFDNAKIFRHTSAGIMGRFHPTQKPVELYAWIFGNYAKAGDKILDTHLGSGSSRIAAWDAGLDFVGCEIDPEYFEKQEERFAAHSAQISLFNQ